MCSAGGAVRGCSCLNCTNNVECTIISIGAALALASGKAERRQLHPLNKCFRFEVQS